MRGGSCARSDTMVSDGPLMADPKGPIRLVVSPKYVFGVHGRLIDDRASRSPPR